MGVYLPFIPRLPSAYQEVEYIQSSGTQRIDTWVTATQSTKSQIKFMNLEYSWDVIYWLYNSNDNTDYRFFNKYNNNVNIWAAIFDFKSSRILSWTDTILTNVVYELELWNYYVKNIETWTNIVSWTAISSYTSPRTITLNNYNNSTYSKNRWYYVKIYNWNTLQRDFVPCYRKSDNVIGLYDLANNQFYTNSWSGTFTKWADVTMTELKNAYIGEYVEWQYVFDFQNDWLLGCTLSNTQYFGYEAWQWIYASTWGADVSIWCNITLPSSVYWNTLKSVELEVYYPSWGYGNAFGVVVNNGYSFRYSREESRNGMANSREYVWFADGKTSPYYNVWTKSGELVLTYNFTSSAISWEIGWTSYSISDSYANTFVNSFADGTFRLLIVTWGNPNRAYIRKATITTNL